VPAATRVTVTIPTISGTLEGDLSDGRLDGTWNRVPRRFRSCSRSARSEVTVTSGLLFLHPAVLVRAALLCAAWSLLPPALVHVTAQQVPKRVIVPVHVVDKKGVPATDLAPGEIEVLENGKARPVQTLELDRRPLAVALIIDNNSELSTALMQSMVPAGVAAIRALPQGTAIDVWTSGDRPSRIASAADADAAEAALRRVGPVGSNSLLNTVSDASRALPADEKHRTAVIVMTTGTLGDPGGASNDLALKNTSTKPMFLALEWVMKQADPRVENLLEYAATASGGFFERILSVTAFEKRAPKLVALIQAQYRLTWQPGSDPRETRVELKCTRKGTRVVAAQRMSVAW
jgi:hypothetical protein